MSARTSRGAGDGSRAARRRRARQDLADWERGQRARAAHSGRRTARRRPRDARKEPQRGQPSGPRWLRPVMGTRRRRIVAYLVTLVCAAVAGVLLVGKYQAPAARARSYLAFDACLLTRARGLAGPQAAQAWAGLQDASMATHAKVEYLPVMGPQTMAGALPVLSSLAQRNCNVIIAVGTPQVMAVHQDAARYPAIRFVTVGGPAGGGNVTVLTTAAGQITPAVDRLVTAAALATVKT
jgi:hypothetical protein